MRIGIAATTDVTDVNVWSGTPFHYYSILRRHYDVTPVKVNLKRPISSLLSGFVYNRLLKKRYFITFDDAVYKESRKSIETQFKDRFDIILTFDSFLVTALSGYARHIILISDATFDNLLNYYEYRTNLCEKNIRHGHRLQKESFEKVSFACYSSNWAIDNAQQVYGADPKKLKKLYFGSNLSRALFPDQVEETIGSRLGNKTIKLLFPVIYWERKGGEYVLEILNRLLEEGLDARLVVAGKIPEGISSEHIDNMGYIDKRDPEQEERMIELYKQCHFLIMPSKADCTPIAFSEANSFAMPVITSTTGGITEMINDENDNGVAFDLDRDHVEKVVSFISTTMADHERYATICRNAFYAYQSKFNWGITEERIKALIDELKF